MSNIEWTQETWNPVVGCTRVSAGCDNCYAVGMTHRLGAMAEKDIREKGPGGAGKKANYIGLTVLNKRGGRHFNGVVRCVEEALDIPLRRKKPTTWFVNSMSDLFHPEVPFEFIDRVFAVMALTPQHTYQILTKRPERMAEYFARPWYDIHDGLCAIQLGRYYPNTKPPYADSVDIWPLPNVWLGTSCEDQEQADKRIPHLLRCPAEVRFLSCEPLLGEVDLNYPLRFDEHHPAESGLPRGGFLHSRECDGFCDYACGGQEYDGARPIDWVICGGESGPGARPCDIAWIRSIVKQCRDASVPVFVKQLGAYVLVEEGDDDDHGWGTEMVPLYVMPDGRADERSALGYRVVLKDKKGGDMGEWPQDLRVREYPSPVAEDRDTLSLKGRGRGASGGTREMGGRAR